MTVLQAQPLADYGLATGTLTHPLSRSPLNTCEILRLEHTLLRAGLKQYQGLAAQLAAAAAAKRAAGQSAAPSFDGLDHNFFLGEVASLLPSAEALRSALVMRDRQHAGQSQYARTNGIDTLAMESLTVRLQRIERSLVAMEPFSAAQLMGQLTDYASTMRLIEEAKRQGQPANSDLWPDADLRAEALQATMTSGWHDDDDDHDDHGQHGGGDDDGGGYGSSAPPPPRENAMFSFEAALAASANKKANKQQRKKKKKKR